MLQIIFVKPFIPLLLFYGNRHKIIFRENHKLYYPHSTGLLYGSGVEYALFINVQKSNNYYAKITKQKGRAKCNA